MASNPDVPPGRSVTSKVVALLDAFSPSAPELSLNALARESGLPLSTACRLASELVECGLLERNKPGSYRIGLRLWEIGSARSSRPHHQGRRLAVHARAAQDHG